MRDFGSFFMDDPGEPDDVDEVIAKLTPQDALALAVSVFSAMSMPIIAAITYPGWRDDAYVYLAKAVKLNGDIGVCRELVQIGAMAMAITSRLAIEAREKEGLEIEDDAHLMCDPAYLLRECADSFPGDDYVEEALEKVKQIMSGDNEEVKRLNDLFNAPSHEGDENTKSDPGEHGDEV